MKANFLLNSHNYSSAPLIILVLILLVSPSFAHICTNSIYVWVWKTEFEFLRWQEKVRKAKKIQDTCKKQEKMKNHQASLWHWVVNLPNKRRQFMFKYAFLVGYCTTRAAFAPKGKGTIQWRWVTFETHLYVKANHICHQFIIKKLVREWLKKEYLCYKGESREAKLWFFRETISLQRKESRFQLCTQNDCLWLAA